MKSRAVDSVGISVWHLTPSAIMKLATVVFYCFFFTFVSVACFAMWMIDHWMAKHTLGGILPQNVPVSHCE